jgi:hypothetical protein
MISLGVCFAKRVAGARVRAHLRRADPWDEMLSAGLYVESGPLKFHLLQCCRIGKERSVNTDARGS